MILFYNLQMLPGIFYKIIIEKILVLVKQRYMYITAFYVYYDFHCYIKDCFLCCFKYRVYTKSSNALSVLGHCILDVKTETKLTLLYTVYIKIW